MSVISQTAAAMNDGKTPDEIAHETHLPENLRHKPWLQEFYGTYAHAARAYFAGTLGWFDGNPSQLNRLSPRERAMNIAGLAGGATRLLEEMEAARASSQLQWALEISDLLLELEIPREQVLRARASILLELAGQTVNAPVRNYLISCAREIETQIDAK